MSSDVRTERRENNNNNNNNHNNRPRLAPPNQSRREWVPRGFNQVPNPPPSFDPNPDPAGDSQRVIPAATHRGNGGGPRLQFGRRTNHQRSEAPERVSNNNGRRAPKEKPATSSSSSSDLPQLVQEIQEKLTRGAVECMICYDMVRRSAPVWSCPSCFSIFHLSCIKKWARAPTSIDLTAEKNQGLNWRCPGCQSVQLTSSKEIRYLCFCGKRADPQSNLYLTPHSCGEPCRKPLDREAAAAGSGGGEDTCPHVCVLQCHPGPCPPCRQFAPPRPCPCGKTTLATRCSDRRSAATCGRRCGKALCCGRHECERVCHVGPCERCRVPVEASCFCGKRLESVLCGDVPSGAFSCDSLCGKRLACGNHSCPEVCHPGPCGECESLPSKANTCHCGKTSLLGEGARKSCLDPIPTCSRTCEKPLPCGTHFCGETCHSGDCPPCLVKVSQRCRCSSTSRTVECYKTTSESEERFVCDKSCGRKKSCGRHRCSERCCPLSSGDHLSLSGSGGSGGGGGEWDPHLCSMTCGKKLRCGQHSCESLCHSGHCPPCLDTIFSDLTCACGRTSIPPPLPCGTPPPSCQLPCSAPQPCGHSAAHSCHFGDCPPCSVPVSKECIGGHVVLRNIPCGSRDITCNKLCGKTRQCGMHACGRTCHPSPCDGPGPGPEPGTTRASCGQTCGAPRRDCRHTCTSPCHPFSLCPDDRCDFPVAIACSCGRLTATVPCDAGGNGSDGLREASVAQRLLPVEPAGGDKRVPLGQRKLACDEECAKQERKRVLADAFDIVTPSLEALHFGESSAVSELLQDLYRRDAKWVLSVEERCKYLVLGKSRGSAVGLRAHVFCPMVKEKRDAIRVIADRWKLTVSSAGWEPKRFIVVRVTPKSKPPPRIIGVKGTTTTSVAVPGFDPTVDMDPRLVVSFADLPREADISALVLRFGGECELVWLNDKNALAVFHDPARAATAMRRLDHGSVYIGAVSVHPTGGGGGGPVASPASNVWGGTGLPKASDPWKKAAVVQGDSWGGEEWSASGSADVQPSVWKKEAPLAATLNRWTLLDREAAPEMSPMVTRGGKSSTKMAIGGSEPSSSAPIPSVSVLGTDASEVVDDWEKAYDDDNTTV